MTQPYGPPNAPGGGQYYPPPQPAGQSGSPPSAPLPPAAPTGQQPPLPPTGAQQSAGTQEPARPAAGFDDRGHVRRTRAGTLWVGLALGTLLLILLIIFIAQNTATVAIHFLGFAGHFPLALALLIAAVAGALITLVVGALRILQLRRALKRNAGSGRRGVR